VTWSPSPTPNLKLEVLEVVARKWNPTCVVVIVAYCYCCLLLLGLLGACGGGTSWYFVARNAARTAPPSPPPAGCACGALVASCHGPATPWLVGGCCCQLPLPSQATSKRAFIWPGSVSQYMCGQLALTHYYIWP
jgi:hypothetical protein